MSTLSMNRESNNIIYVLAHNEDLLEKARAVYTTSSCFRPILLPQSAWMESIMYTEYLMDHEDEWKECDYVGCISYSCVDKQPLIHQVDEMFDVALRENCDALGFLYKGDPLIQTACHWHTNAFAQAWKDAWMSLGWRDEPALFDDSSFRSFYSNYWVCRPDLMREYCMLMQKLKANIEADPALKRSMWADSTYQDRGSAIAKMPEDTRRALFGVPYYPMLGFVCERMPCAWFSAFHPRAPIKMLLM